MIPYLHTTSENTGDWIIMRWFHCCTAYNVYYYVHLYVHRDMMQMVVIAMFKILLLFIWLLVLDLLCDLNGEVRLFSICWFTSLFCTHILLIILQKVYVLLIDNNYLLIAIFTFGIIIHAGLSTGGCMICHFFII